MNELYNFIAKKLSINEKIIGEEINNKKVNVIVVKWEFGNNIWVMLYNDTKYLACNAHPRIMATKKNDENGTFVFIDDFLTVDLGHGNGTILMKYLIDYCKENKINRIKGAISSVDEDHFDKLKHFYKKFGFDFILNGNSGHILLNIKACK